MKKETFESRMEELEALVSALEAGDMPLEESFKAYERGMELYRSLDKMLNEGDARIRELTQMGEKEITEEGKSE